MSISASEAKISQSNVFRYFLRNYVLHSLEGGFYLGGIAFIAFETILPRMVEFLQGPVWIVSLMPALSYLGFNFPPILTAHKIDKLNSVKPLLMITGFFQRSMFLFAGLALIFFSTEQRILSLIAVVLAPLFSGLIGGVSMTAWNELVAKTIPENRRSSLFSVRYIISSIIGIIAGGIIASVLGKWPGAKGFGILHIITFGLVMASYLLFSFLKETTTEAKHQEQDITLGKNLKLMVKLIRTDRQLRCYLLTHSISNGFYIVMPFMTIFTLRVLNQPDCFMGYLVTAQMIGGITGNIVTGYLGDRLGGKAVMIFFRIIFILVCAWMAIAGSEWIFLVNFFLLGAAFFAYQVGHSTLSIEICPYQKRATYLAIIAFFNAISMVFFSVISGLLWKWTGSFYLLVISTIIMLLISTYYLLKIKEPRHNNKVIQIIN